MRSYNLFRSTGVEGLCCAVPEACAVPAFIGRGRWSFGGKISGKPPGGSSPGGKTSGGKTPSGKPPGGGRALSDFDGRAADTAVRFNGYYLFQTVDRRFVG